MTTRSRWDETRALIEAGWHSGWKTWANPIVSEIYSLDQSVIDWDWHPWRRMSGVVFIDWDDITRAEADADRMLYGGLGTPQRED